MKDPKISVGFGKGVISISYLYDQFYMDLDESTGTILIHHGKAKFPGKYVKNYSKIELSLKCDNALDILEKKARELSLTYSLNKIFVYHSLGEIHKNDPILFIGVEGKDRDSSFAALREMLELIKTDNLIDLKELD